jgi:hypothetical protein
MAKTLSYTPDAIRTHDLLLRRQSLYPLSYRGPYVRVKHRLADDRT